jgi:hypothetical protein
MSFLVCNSCNQEIAGDKVILSPTVYGKCQICGEDIGKRIIFTLKLRTRKPEEARKIMDNFRFWDKFFQGKDENGSIFLSEVPAEKLKSNVKKVMHLRIGPKNVKCLYAQETKKGIEFIHGFHHSDFCPAINRPNKLKRR